MFTWTIRLLFNRGLIFIKIRGDEMKSLILSIIWELNIKSYQKVRECGWKHRQKSLHLIPETKY